MTINNIIDKYLGIPYSDNGRDPSKGLDCWGLIMCVMYDLFQVEIPDTNYKKFSSLHQKISIIKEAVYAAKAIKDRYDMSQWVLPVNKPKFGDLVLICPIKDLPIHAGIYLNSEYFIHSTAGQGVSLGEINLWKHQIQGYYRLREELIK